MVRFVFTSVFIFGSLFNFVQLQRQCPQDPPKPCFTQQDLNNEISTAINELAAIESTFEANKNYPGFAMVDSEPAYINFKTHKFDQVDIDDHRLATAVKTALTRLQASKQLTKSQLQKCIESPLLTLSSFCKPKPLDCDPNHTTYYTPSGMCNNRLHPTWGAVGTPLIRLFDSGVGDYTKHPSARLESSLLKDQFGFDDSKPPGFNNDMATMIVQVLTHETLNTKKAQHMTEQRGGGYNCCNPKNDTFLAGLIKMNPNCMPVDIPQNDFCYGNTIKSLNYIAAFKVLDECKLTAHPLSKNFETAFIDGNLVYNKQSLDKLNANGGKFNVNNIDEMKAHIVNYDERSMLLPGLFIFLNLFTFFHNIIFDNFKALKPFLNSSQLMFESRKLTTAAFQKVYLDMIIDIMPDAEGELRGFNNCYNDSIHPQVTLEHNLCLRSMHTFIRDDMATYQESFFRVPNGLKGKQTSSFDIGTVINNLTLYTDNKCGLTHGLLDTSWNVGQGNGQNILCNFMAPLNVKLGSDLRMMDFQASYDNSEPAYVTAAQKLYNISKCPSEMTKDDLPQHNFETKNFLNDQFNGDISKLGYLFGILTEDKQGNVLGPTEKLVILDQMKRSICGDRFWFSNGFALTKSQVKVISNNVDFSTIICLVNNCNGTRIQSNPFLSASRFNTKITCPPVNAILASFDLANW